MAGPEIPIANSRLGMRAIARHSLVVLLATEAFGVVAAHAADATWVGGNGGDPMEWVEDNNWTPTAVPNGVATFTSTGVTTVANDNGIVIVGEVFFTGTPNAQAYTINIDNPFIVNAAGIINNSTNTQTCLERQCAGVPERQLRQRRLRHRSAQQHFRRVCRF